MEIKEIVRNGYTYQLQQLQADVDFTEAAPFPLRLPPGKTRIISRFPLNLRMPGGCILPRVRDVILDIDNPGTPILVYESEGTVLREYISIISWDPSGHPGPAMPDMIFQSGIANASDTWTMATTSCGVMINPLENQFFNSIFVDKIVAWRMSANSKITSTASDEIAYCEIQDITPSPIMEVPNEREPDAKGTFYWEAKNPSDSILIPHFAGDNLKFYGVANGGADTYLFTWVQYRGL